MNAQIYHYNTGREKRDNNTMMQAQKESSTKW